MPMIAVDHTRMSSGIPCFLSSASKQTGVGTGDQYEDHRMIDSSKEEIYLLGNIERMIKGACSIEKNHAADKYAHGKNDNRIIRVHRFADQWEGTDNCTDHSD